VRETIFKLFSDLKENKTNTICFFRQNLRIEKTFSEFGSDVDLALAKLDYLKHTKGIRNVAIIGPVSYDWIVCDMACIMGGFLSLAIPETLSEAEVEEILRKTDADIALVDFRLRQKYSLSFIEHYNFECLDPGVETDFWLLQELNVNLKENRILKEYGIIFSSGTSRNIKYIKGVFNTPETKKKTFIENIKKIIEDINYKRSFWSGVNNKLIIFMPFSHSQQRGFFREALFLKINIILSNPESCIKHIITEKPNMMISVPVVYETIATRIKAKLNKLNRVQHLFFKIFNSLRINTLSNNNYLKRIFCFFLFKEIKKTYGGRSDFFVTGSAPIGTEAIETFYSIGVKILQAYGQTEIGNIAMSSPTNFKIGSVGKPLMNIKISNESEILVKYEEALHSSNKDILIISEDDYIHTGDLGYLDKKGYLFITGRKDDVIVLETGKKVFPQKIESLIKTSDLIKDTCVFIKEGYKFYAVLECVGKPHEEEVKKVMQHFNNQLQTHERINAYYITEDAFSEENGQLTRTFKKRRESIRTYFSTKIFTSL